MYCQRFLRNYFNFCAIVKLGDGKEMANSFNEIFGKNLKRIMYDRNITQAQMSKELNIPKTTISSWMNGKRAPKMDMFDKICSYLNCRRSDLMEEQIPDTITMRVTEQERRLVEYMRYLNKTGAPK